MVGRESGGEGQGEMVRRGLGTQHKSIQILEKQRSICIPTFFCSAVKKQIREMHVVLSIS